MLVLPVEIFFENIGNFMNHGRIGLL